MIASSFLQDLISAGHLSPEMSYLACDAKKIDRARKAAMKSAQWNANVKHASKTYEGVFAEG